jgi:hypothetical protein
MVRKTKLGVIGAVCVLFLFQACTPAKKSVIAMQPKPLVSETFALDSAPVNSPLLESLLQKMPESFAGILANPNNYKLQVIYTQINRDALNKPYFSHHYYNVTEDYTYPASTIKLPVAVLALEKLNTLAIDGLGINTSMFTDPLRPGEKPVFEDASSKNGKPGVGHYIKKILLVSDNDANNRLYEFLGQEPLNKRLHALGFKQAELTHRLSMALTNDENRVTNPVWFMDASGKTVYRQPYAVSKMEFARRHEKLGNAFLKSGAPGQPDVLVNEPLDFSTKNRWPIKYAHQLTQWILFPEAQPDSNRLLLTASDYTFLWKYMSMLPGESNYPSYPSDKYWPAYVKFLSAGSEKGPWFNPDIRIFNKVGNAYGHLLDAAYVVDFKNNVEFFLSAVIYCNSDGVLNDDKYDYDSVGFPFMKALGKTIYEYELTRERKNIPDLSRFKINYAE